MSYSCAVGVDSVSGEDFGATADLSYRPNGGIDISPAPFSMQITEDAAGIVVPAAELVMTIAAKDEVTLASIERWLGQNKASMTVHFVELGPAIDPEWGFTVTVSRAGKPDLQGTAGGSIGLAFGVAIKGA